MADECFHGGRFHAILGERLEHLSRLASVVPADVLDAWFQPAPAVLEALRESLPFLARTAPPAGAEPLAFALAEAFQVETDATLPGAGSSSLIFLAFQALLREGDSMWSPDPGYGEYRHLANLRRARAYGSALWDGEIQTLQAVLTEGHDLVVIINPNNPTGWKLPAYRLQELIEGRSSGTRVWVDEAYAAYRPEIGTLARYASTHRGVFVCRSLSKSHALSGLRVAGLFAHPEDLAPLRTAMAPWSVSFPAQLAGIIALREHDYYTRRYNETASLRSELERELLGLGFRVTASEANWLLLEHDLAGEVIRFAESEGVYLRDPSSMRSTPWTDSIRVAVRSGAENDRVCCVLQKALERL